MPRPAAVITTQKEMSLSGNYYILSDHSELEHDYAADFDEEAEADSDRLLAFERGLLPLDIAWFFNVFQRFDYDKSGTISAAELGDVLRFLGQNPLNFEVEQMVRSATPINGEQQIKFGAFLRLMELLPAPGDVIEECFRVIDRDSTGLISREELSSVLLTQGEVLSNEEFEAMMAYADKNGDGVIDYKEFAALLTGSTEKVTQEMARITDLDIVMAVQQARAHGYTRIKRAVGKGGIRATEYIAPSLDRSGHFRTQPNGDAAAPAAEAAGDFQLDMTGSPRHAAHLVGVRVETKRTTNGNGLLLGTGQALQRKRIGAVRPPVRGADLRVTN